MPTPEDVEWRIEISAKLGAIEATLKRVEAQVLATNGRTSALELVNAVATSERASKHTFWGTIWAIVGAVIGAAAVLFAGHK
jgi:hypothetical protein